MNQKKLMTNKKDENIQTSTFLINEQEINTKAKKWMTQYH